MSDEQRIRNQLRALAEQYSWREISDDGPVPFKGKPPRSLFEFANRTWTPTKVETRRSWGLPVLVPTVACECGDVHTQKTCPHRHPRKQGQWLGARVSLVLKRRAEIESANLGITQSSIVIRALEEYLQEK